MTFPPPTSTAVLGQEVADPTNPGGTPWTGNAPPPGGGAQAFRQELSKLFPKAEGEPLLLPFDISAVAGVATTYVCESGIPEFWHVALRPIANSRVSCFNGPETSGVPYRLGGGGKLKVRAKSEYFTVVIEPGSAAVLGTLVALRKMEFEMEGGAL